MSKIQQSWDALHLQMNEYIIFRYPMYQRKVNVDMLNAVKSVLADVSSVNPSSEQSLCLLVH